MKSALNPGSPQIRRRNFLAGAAVLAAGLFQPRLLAPSVRAQVRQPPPIAGVKPFHERMLPALKGKGFRQEGYWVWCGSVVEGEDGRFHMFASRWPKKYPFFQGYRAASEVVRASADRPEGPYRFEEVVLSARGADFWDGRVTHNPQILKCGDEYLLFYIGDTFEGPIPSPKEMFALNAESGGSGRGLPWKSVFRIGMARSRSVFGPWHRPLIPILDPKPTGWDKRGVTNPFPCLTPEKRILLYYRSDGRIGLATAEGPESPFTRSGDKPVVDLGEGIKIEDECVFYLGDHYEMLCKDCTGKVTGEYHAGIHLLSPDGVAWKLAPKAKAWSRTITWDDGTTSTQANIERPCVLLRDRAPGLLFAATADGSGPRDGRPGHYFAENTWNMVFPLKP